MPIISEENNRNHCDEIHEIITTPPTWILRWGMGLMFSILLVLVGLSAYVRYPDIVRTTLIVNSTDAPKAIKAKKSGKLVKLLVLNNQNVRKFQALALIESTADHMQVLALLDRLKKIQTQPLELGSYILPADLSELQLGEMQEAYQDFIYSYISYKATTQNGIYAKRRRFLEGHLDIIAKQREHLAKQKQSLERELELAQDEYNAFEVLAAKKVIAPIELKREESKLISKEIPIQNTESEIIQNINAYSNKEKEIMEVENAISEERLKFIQALGSLISQLEVWKSNYVLTASQSGRVVFAGIVQENQQVEIGMELFRINSGNTDFFGEMLIPQDNMGKVKEGKDVLVKLKSYPYPEFGILKGKISYIAPIPYQDSLFISKVSFSKNRLASMKKKITLQNGMLAEAEIITNDASLLQRMLRAIFKATQ